MKKENKTGFSPIGKVIIAISLSAAFLITAVNIGVYTYAKYHSEDSGKGVATVSADFYFTGNYFSHVDSIGWTIGTGQITESEAIDEAHNFDYSYAQGDWEATTPCTFNIEVYNYENTLRYNAETVKYTLYVKLLGEPANPEDTYTFSVYNDDRTETLDTYTLNDGNLVKVEDLTLVGDAPNRNYFSLTVNPANPDTYVPVNVIAYAEITSPDYIDSTIYYIGTIFSPQAARQSFSVKGAFDAEAEIDNGADWLKTLNGLSGYIYTVTTEGEADAEKDIILYWNSEYITLDLHNGVYTEKTVLTSDGEYKERIPIKYDEFVATGKVADLPAEKQNSAYTDYLVYHTAANRSEMFIFYKTENWNTTTEFNEAGENILKPSSYSEFKKLAKAVLY